MPSLKPLLHRLFWRSKDIKKVLVCERSRFKTVSKNDQMKSIRLIEGCDLGICDALTKYDVPRSTYYRWKRKLKTMGIKGLQDNKPKRRAIDEIIHVQETT